MKISKSLLKAILCFALLLTASNITIAKTINFAIASDIHYKTTTTPTDNQKALNGFVSRMNENNYDFVIFLGDNIDKSKEKELVSFLNIIKQIKSPYYLVMGDKDVHKISGMDKKKYIEIVAKYNKNQKKTQSSYTFKPNKDITVIVLDSVSSGMQTTHGVISAKTLSWLDATLTKNKNKKVLIFQHVPYYEPYAKQAYDILDKQEYKAILSKHNNILAVISGHYHKEFAKDDNGVIHYCVPALSENPYYYVESTLKYKKLPLQKAKNFTLNGVVKPAI